MASTTNMGLTTWGPNDYFNDLELKLNWEKVDAHDHDPSNNGGVRIGSNAINNEAITEAKLAAGAVTDEKIADNTITKFKLANDLVVALETAAEALSAETIFGTATTATVTGDYTNLQLKDGSIVDTHISESAQINPSKIDLATQSGLPLSDTNGVVDTSAISSGGTVRGSFNSLNIQPNAVGEGQIANGAVTSDKIYTGAVTSAKIADQTIATGDLSSTVSNGLTITGKAWTSYTPTLGHINGTVILNDGVVLSGAYQKIHNTILVRIAVSVNSGGSYWLGNTTNNSSLAGTVTFGLPTTAAISAQGSWYWNYGGSASDFGVASVGASTNYAVLRGKVSYDAYNYGGYLPGTISMGPVGKTFNVGNDGGINIWDSNTKFNISIAYQTA